MFAQTTLSGDNMSVLFLQLVLVPTNWLNFCCFRNNSFAIIPNINWAVKSEATDHLTIYFEAKGTSWSPWAFSGLGVEAREVYSCHDLECLLTILSSPLKRWKILLFHTFHLFHDTVQVEALSQGWILCPWFSSLVGANDSETGDQVILNRQNSSSVPERD